VKLSTADPIPAGKIDVDGVSYDVWHFRDVPNGSIDAFLRLRPEAEHMLDAEHLVAHPEVMVSAFRFYAPTVPAEALAKLAERPIRLYEGYVTLLGVAQVDPLLLTAGRAERLRRATTAPSTSSTSTASAAGSPLPSGGTTASASASPSGRRSRTSTRTKGSPRSAPST
jgi:hypothetical protein